MSRSCRRCFRVTAEEGCQEEVPQREVEEEEEEDENSRERESGKEAVK